jgi:hypothetical protein
VDVFLNQPTCFTVYAFIIYQIIRKIIKNNQIHSKKVIKT